MPKKARGSAAKRLNALVRYRARYKMEMEILDIGAGGCMVDARGWSVKPDEVVSVKFPDMAYIAGKVVWLEDRRAGIAFDEPLYGPIFEHLKEQTQAGV